MRKNVFINCLNIFCAMWLSIDDTRTPKGYVEDHVDVIEHNYFYNAEGGVQLDQYIFLRYSPSLSTYIVIAWRTNKQFNPPYKNGKGYLMTFYDARDTTYRKVHAKHIRESHTDYDPEIANHELMEGIKRPDLSRKPK
jgi:hypothetical protein